MTSVNSISVVSCYADAAAFVVMILLLILSERLRHRKDLSHTIFFKLCLALTFSCVFSFICHITYMQPGAFLHGLAIFSRTLWEWLVFQAILLWSSYVGLKLFGKMEKLPLIAVLGNISLGVFSVLLVVNFFTGIVFSYTQVNECVTTVLYDVVVALETVYFLASLVLVMIFDRQSEKARFIRVLPMLISVELGVIVQFFLPYQTDVLGFAIGAVLLYFSMADELRYLDEESGLYNVGMLNYLLDRTLAGKDSTRSVLIVEAGGDERSCFDILNATLHREGDVIRVDDSRFLMFSGDGGLNTVQRRSSLVEEAVERHNTEHPDELVRMKVTCRLRKADEDILMFIRAVTEDRNAGDPVRGVISMIAELDQLDQELKLAADIQHSMLPMNFPPFPDRNEFELYALMDPAKDVGGDFYDFFLIDDDHLALVIADVSGKGIPASLFMMVSKTLIKNQLLEQPDPAAALKSVNAQLSERNSSMMFATVWLAVLEISTGKGLVCNSGHENPTLRRAGQDFEVIKYKHCAPVGISKSTKYVNREFTLAPGDCVFEYTDGVPEAVNGRTEAFGDERLLASLNKDPDSSPEELIRRMHDDVYTFAEGTAQFDDITMLCVKYYGPDRKNDGPEQPPAE